MDSKRIPPPGKKWARKEIDKMVRAMRKPMFTMTNKELRAIIATLDQFTSSNCGWSEYWAKDIIRKFSADQLNDNIKFKKRKSK